MEARDLLLSPDLSADQVAAVLSRFGFRELEKADGCLQRMAGLVGQRERLAELISEMLSHLAGSADPDAALVHLERFFEAVPSAATLTAYLRENPAALEVLVKLLGASPFLTEILVRNPGYFYWLFEENRLEHRPPAEYFRCEAKKAAAFEQRSTALDSLRRLRRRECLRVAAQDLLRRVDFGATVGQISELADALLQEVFDLLYPRELEGRGFAVLGLGKLGGEELNFSSDVDLLYVYADDQQADAMVRFARRYTRALGEFTGEGHLYRVDLRLRPMGRSGEIVYPLAAYRHYYETFGDTFDRLALIKCRWVAGDWELGDLFLRSVRDFVYRKYLDSAAIDEIRWLKKRSDRKVARRGESRHDVKLGFGGIREIEFFVQAFQILYGGRAPQIRTQNTLRALQQLVDEGFIPLRDFQILHRSYVFLRELEHRLQLVYDQQTQRLPADPRERERCARRMGYLPHPGKSAETDLESFERALVKTTESVRKLFTSLFAGGDGGGLSDLILDPALEPTRAHALLQAEGVPFPEEVFSGIRRLVQAPAFPHGPTRVRNLLTNLLPKLLEGCKRCPEPGLFLSRFDRFCESVGSRVDLYQGLIDDSALASRLIRVLSTSEFLTEALIRHPELLDFMARPVPQPPSEDRLTQMLAGGGAGDDADLLRRFKHREEFKIALNYLEVFDETACRRSLTRLAEICLEKACQWSLDRLPSLGKESFSLLALGRLGGSELTFHSDLDLVLVYDDSSASAKPHLFEDFLRRLSQGVEEYTAAGRAYQLDFRLRPEGRRASPATPASVMRHYFAERAQAWERLAYVKVRDVFGQGKPPKVSSLLQRRPLESSDLEQLLHIRRRKELEIGREQKGAPPNFKVGRGGLLDIQFILHYLQIQHQIDQVNTFLVLDNLIAKRVLDVKQGAILREGLSFLEKLESLCRLLAEKSVDCLPRASGQMQSLVGLMALGDEAALLERYREITEGVRSVFEAVLGECSGEA